MATREFLNPLARTKPADRVPFIYMSDHDAGYGSVKEAWLSVSQRIPKLEWWGLTVRQYLELVDRMTELKLEEFAAANKDWDGERCRTEVSNWVQQRKAHFHEQYSSTIPNCDLTRLVNLRQLLGIEPRLGQDIK